MTGGAYETLRGCTGCPTRCFHSSGFAWQCREHILRFMLKNIDRCVVSHIKRAKQSPFAEIAVKLHVPIVVSIRDKESCVLRVARKSYDRHID